MAKIILIGGLANSLINFRGDLIKALVDAGHQVTAVSASADIETINKVKVLGAHHVSVPIERSSLNPFADLRTFLALRKKFRALKPDIILAYTIKPVIWGGFAAMATPGARFHALITGLGFAFQGESLRRRLLTKVVGTMYKIALSGAETAIFQNQDNRNLFVSRAIVTGDKCHVVGGSGVNLSQFKTVQIPPDDLNFLVIARLLKEKGLYEFYQAARDLKTRFPQANFQILGPADPSPDGISIKLVKQWEDEGIIEYLGETDDVRPFLAQCGVFVLPSYHEGMPRTVLEAMATGRPVLTTNISGCRETVEPAKNGFLVPPADSKALAERMEWFINNREKWPQMGKVSRELAQQRFDVHKINKQILQILNLSDNNN